EVPLKKKKEVDMDLAYGSIPADLKPDRPGSHIPRRSSEGLPDEVDCVQHTASSMIAHLEENPQAAGTGTTSLASEASYEEALALEEDPGTTEIWRRGIQPLGPEVCRCRAHEP
ncbi:hypothetical protein MMYC01_210022, partial [Madurella mycetomatis]